VVVRAALPLLVLCGIARAQPAEFAREFQAGVDAFRLGKYDAARARLEQARALEPKLAGPSRFLAAVAQAQGRWDDCITAARRALALNPRSSERSDTRKLHDACRASAGRAPYRGDLGDRAAIAVTSNVPGAAVKIGGLAYGATPLGPRPITAGALALELSKPGWRPARFEVEALPGIVTDVAVELAAEPPPPPPPPPRGARARGSGSGL
jgi:tetratricopeptide (TPR) repeat protein